MAGFLTGLHLCVLQPRHASTASLALTCSQAWGHAVGTLHPSPSDRPSLPPGAGPSRPG